MTLARTLLIAALSISSAAGQEPQLIDLPHADGVSLAAKLTLPPGRTASRALLLIPPAGPADPDLSLGPQGIYRAVAEHLAGEGVASLRISSRGIAPATGDWRQTSFNDRVADAAAAFDWLQGRPALSSSRIAIAGISEGGAVAMAVAQRRNDIAAVVLISTPMRDGVHTMRWQRGRLLAGSALTPSQRQLVVTESDKMLAGVAAGDEAAVRAVLAGPAGNLVLPPYGMVPNDVEERVAFVLSPWYRSQVNYDIGALVEELRLPVFAAYGDLDWVIDGPEAAQLLAERLADGVPAEIRTLPERNHLMMPARTGSPLEYAQLPQVIDAELWSEIADWLAR